MDATKSGSAAVDLHIHDSDFVQYVFGMPKAVFSRTSPGPSNDADHIVTQYVYDDACVVTAEGGWSMSPTFGFEMSFNIVLEKATITYDCTREPAFKVCPVEDDVFTPEIASGDGYSNEIEHFVKAVRGEDVPQTHHPTAVRRFRTARPRREAIGRLRRKGLLVVLPSPTCREGPSWYSILPSFHHSRLNPTVVRR